MTDTPEPWKPAAGEAEAAWQTALAGDREAFQKAVAPYLEELFKAARRERRYRIALGDLTADDLTAEEIAGETLIRAWDDRHGRPPELGLRAWLLAGMFRVVADIVRREGRFRRTAAVSLERPVPQDPVYDDDDFWEWYQPDEVTRWEDVLADAEPTPEEMAATDEEFNRSLPPLARETFLLHEVHNVPVREVALALHVPERQVMHLLAEARKRLEAPRAEKLHEDAMPYFVKWYIAGQDEAQEQQTAYATSDHAMDFACAILRQDPADIWVEDDSGNQVALAARIRRHCAARGSPEPMEQPAFSKLDLGDLERYRVRSGGKGATLADIPASDGKGFPFDKKEAQAATADDVAAIDRLQDILYAEGRRAILIILQGMDASGKDGTIRKVFGPIDPLGITASNFKKPAGDELAHDYLWRIHKAVPPARMIGIFNRSHYEDVVTVGVLGLVPPERIEQRYQQINDFERHLAWNDVTILKFFLHISKDEQKKRLQERLDIPEKRWKFSPDDLAARSRWDSFAAAYETALDRCSTRWAPWFIVPADRKWYRNAVIARIVRMTLEAMDLSYPAEMPGLNRMRIE